MEPARVRFQRATPSQMFPLGDTEIGYISMVASLIYLEPRPKEIKFIDPHVRNVPDCGEPLRLYVQLRFSGLIIDGNAYPILGHMTLLTAIMKQKVDTSRRPYITALGKWEYGMLQVFKPALIKEPRTPDQLWLPHATIPTILHHRLLIKLNVKSLMSRKFNEARACLMCLVDRAARGSISECGRCDTHTRHLSLDATKFDEDSLPQRLLGDLISFVQAQRESIIPPPPNRPPPRPDGGEEASTPILVDNTPPPLDRGQEASTASSVEPAANVTHPWAAWDHRVPPEEQDIIDSEAEDDADICRENFLLWLAEQRRDQGLDSDDEWDPVTKRPRWASPR